MQIRNLGQSGLRVSSIGLGCNNFGGRIDDAATKAVIHKALDLGISLFDTADVYGERGGSEAVMGRILGDDRKRIVLATKFAAAMDDSGEQAGGSRHYIVAAVEHSLRRLKTDWIDLYQMHRPDPRTPIEETLRALDDLIRQGKVRYIGCSNFAAWQITDAAWTARTAGLNGFVSCQDEYSLLHRAPEPELLPAARKLGFGLLPYFPLASGLLTGKYRRNTTLPAGTRLAATQRLADRYLTERNWPIVEKLGDFAASHGHSMLQLAFSWLLAQTPVASVIAGATRPEQLEQNVTAGDWAQLNWRRSIGSPLRRPASLPRGQPASATTVKADTAWTLRLQCIHCKQCQHAHGGRFMTTLTIRNLDPALKQRLRVRAAHNGHSMEAELRDILGAALSADNSGNINLADAIRRRFAPLGGVELQPHPPQSIGEPPSFK